MRASGKIALGRRVAGPRRSGWRSTDFDAPPGLRWIHRSTDEAEIYFVASNSPRPREVVCSFRMLGFRPEFWRPETGEIEPVAVYEKSGDTLRIPIAFEPNGSVFVVFRPAPLPDAEADPVVAISLDGTPLVPAPAREPAITDRQRPSTACPAIPGGPGTSGPSSRPSWTRGNSRSACPGWPRGTTRPTGSSRRSRRSIRSAG